MNRLFVKIDKKGPDECWPWTGRIDRNGYGRFDMQRRPQLAHRIAYFIANPQADTTKMVCHSCDNPRCCNPKHLWLGTQRQNVEDMDRKGRRKNGPVRKGELCNKAKLTKEQAISIFHSSESGPVLAARFGITKEAVNHIKRGKNWAHATVGVCDAS